MTILRCFGGTTIYGNTHIASTFHLCVHLWRLWPLHLLPLHFTAAFGCRLKEEIWMSLTLFSMSQLDLNQTPSQESYNVMWNMNLVQVVKRKHLQEACMLCKSEACELKWHVILKNQCIVPDSVSLTWCVFFDLLSCAFKSATFTPVAFHFVVLLSLAEHVITGVWILDLVTLRVRDSNHQEIQSVFCYS